MNRKSQVFTPANYVEELLDSVDYKANLHGKKVLENSCGDGNILVAIVQRYIDDCNKCGIKKEIIRHGLMRDIIGFEIDEHQYKKCIENLNRILERNEIEQIEWSIYNKDYLKTDIADKYQFIIGNPPYIKYSELDKKEQKFLKEKFESCKKGKFDYCYAFIEKSVDLLAKNGKMSYLIPSSIFKTVFGERMRNYVKPFIVEIRDFTQVKMFDNALVKSAIMILSGDGLATTLHYIDVGAGIELNMEHDNLENKWFFTNDAVPGTRKFGEYFRVAHVVATLLNEAFVLKEEDYRIQEQFYLINGIKIEKKIVRETATPRTKRYKKVEKIIFPYDYDKGKLIKYNEEEFKKNFPGANQYLEGYREALEERESDKNAKWYEYGRSQALSGLNHRKLLLSTVVTGKPVVYYLNKKCIPYSGMYITVKKRNQQYRLDDAKNILESAEFMQYVEKVGIHISGSSLRITSKDIEEYRF